MNCFPLRQVSQRVQSSIQRVKITFESSKTQPNLNPQLTAISGLSARTCSCGGEGSRFGGGVSDSFFLKYLVMPTGSSTTIGLDSSSVGGADDSDESSESESFDMLDVEGGCARGDSEVMEGKQGKVQ